MEFKISSDTIGQISGALAKAQETIGNAVKDSNNPFFKSKYADLAAVRNACQKPLSENGLSISGSVICDNSTWIYVGTLSHKESGEWFRTYIPLILSKNDMQAFGSAQTYAERYALKSLVNCATEDDDGNSACNKETGELKPESKCTLAQIERLKTGLAITDEEYSNICKFNHVNDLKDLTLLQAQKAILNIEKKRENNGVKKD